MYGATESASLRMGWNALGVLVLISWNVAAAIFIFGILKGSFTQRVGGVLQEYLLLEYSREVLYKGKMIFGVKSI